MVAVTVKRSDFKTFLNTGTLVTPTWSLVGDGVTTAKITYQPQTTQEVFIHQDSGTTELESYSPNFPVEMKAKKGDAAFDFVDGLRQARAVLDDAKTEIVNVWLYETAVSGAYPAERQAVGIQIDDFGGDGGTASRINYTINYLGDPVLGTFNPSTLVFTPAP